MGVIGKVWEIIKRIYRIEREYGKQLSSLPPDLLTQFYFLKRIYSKLPYPPRVSEGELRNHERCLEEIEKYVKMGLKEYGF
ncbi:MAG: hypothetical protein QW040_02820 [Candidatus Aenigmatarchaeota archaeon]